SYTFFCVLPFISSTFPDAFVCSSSVASPNFCLAFPFASFALPFKSSFDIYNLPFLDDFVLRKPSHPSNAIPVKNTLKHLKQLKPNSKQRNYLKGSVNSAHITVSFKISYPHQARPEQHLIKSQPHQPRPELHSIKLHPHPSQSELHLIKFQLHLPWSELHLSESQRLSPYNCVKEGQTSIPHVTMF